MSTPASFQVKKNSGVKVGLIIMPKVHCTSLKSFVNFAYIDYVVVTFVSKVMSEVILVTYFD